MSKVPCPVCRERRDDFHRGTCRRCHTNRLNRRALEALAAELKPASPYNRELFRFFFGDFAGRYIKNSDLPAARRLVAYLAVHPIEQISSWETVLKLSEAAKIRYTNHATQGCPFIRIGRAMERLGRITSRRDARTGQLLNVMASFPNEIRPVMHEFYQDVAKAHKRTSSALKILNSVNVFGQALKKPLFQANEADAEKFIAGLRRYGSAHFTERVRSLKRFYRWACTREYCRENPFANRQLSHLRRACPDCGNTKTFWTADHLCDECYKNDLFRKKHATLIGDARPAADYNRHLFTLYLKYLNRYKMRSAHLRSTKMLIAFLEAKELRPMRSWLDVARTRKAFMAFHGLQKIPAKGCPIEKIAYVLQELGVLPLREEDHAVYVETALNRADSAFASIVRVYFRDLKRQRRSVRALHASFKMIHDYYLWLKDRGQSDLFAASEEMARQYILSRPTRDRSGVLRKVLGKFYRWAILRKRTIFNPFARIEPVKPQHSLEICSNDAIAKLERFIKRSTSEPEGALILCLIFYFGFTAKDLAMASVDATGEALCITLHRGELTFGHNVHKRSQVLRLPSNPNWLGQLQKRYLMLWRERYAKIKQDFPLSPLILRADSRHGRPVRTLAIRERVEAATAAAVGFKIPVSVIRRTGAHIYSRQVGASILPQFGWSLDYSFDFVWRQRRLFAPKQK